MTKLLPVAVLFLLSLLSLGSSPCLAQTSFASAEEAATALQTCSGDRCKDLSIALHLNFTFDPKRCPYPEYAHSIQGSFEHGYEDALLPIKCSYDFQLVALGRDSSGRWSYIDSVYLGATYDRLTFGLARVISPNEDDIIIHNDVVIHGTGIYQANFEILRIANRKLRAVLDTIEEGSVYPYGDSNGAVQQKSKFQIATATNKSSGAITETMILNAFGRKTVLEREFDWRSDFGTFEPSFWTRPMKPDASENKKKSG